jgi:hypothetical protein
MRGVSTDSAGGRRGKGDMGDVVIDGVSLCLSPLCAVLMEDYLAGQVLPLSAPPPPPDRFASLSLLFSLFFLTSLSLSPCRCVPCLWRTASPARCSFYPFSLALFASVSSTPLYLSPCRWDGDSPSHSLSLD